MLAQIIFFDKNIILQDLFPVKSNDVEILKKVCSALEDCQGFNTNGWLKQSIGQTYKTNIDLYVKEKPMVSLWKFFLIVFKEFHKDT